MKPPARKLGIEIGKWLLVFLLLLPLGSSLTSRTQLFRVVAGIALAIIFIGKFFYDTIVYKFTRRDQPAGHDLVNFLFIVILFFLIIGFFAGLLGFIMVHYFNHFGQQGIG